ncbi:MAG: hypothetical protein AB1397_03965 [bacterium]
MKTKKVLISKGMACLITLALLGGLGQAEGTETKGARIVLDEQTVEDEIILVKKGREVKRCFATGEEKERIIAEAKTKGISVKINPDARTKPPRLRFIDEKGKTIKEIPLICEEKRFKKKITTEIPVVYEGEIIKKKIKDEEREFEKIIKKGAIISPNSKYALMESAFEERLFLYEDEIGEGGMIYDVLSEDKKIILYDASGKKLYEKPTPWGFQGIAVSNNAELAFISALEGCEWEELAPEVLHVYDSFGK